MADTENTVVTEEIGSVLQKAREASGASLDDISALLKIRAVHLQALEEDDFEALPGSVYAIGFIRTYANYLELNGAELIARYKAATMPPHLEEPGYNPQTEVEPISGALKIAIGVVGIFAFYILWLIAGGAGGSAPERADTAPPAIAADAEESRTSALEKPVTLVQRPARQEGQSNAASANDTATVLPEADPIASEPVVEVQPIGSLTSLPPQSATSPAADSAVGSVVESVAVADAAAEIEIRAVRRTWMRVEDAAGKVLFSSIIREGEGFTFGEADAYTLATRDAGALQYLVNEQAVGAVGRRGQILTARKIDRATILSLPAQ